MTEHPVHDAILRAVGAAPTLEAAMTACTVVTASEILDVPVIVRSAVRPEGQAYAVCVLDTSHGTRAFFSSETSAHEVIGLQRRGSLPKRMVLRAVNTSNGRTCYKWRKC